MTPLMRFMLVTFIVRPATCCNFYGNVLLLGVVPPVTVPPPRFFDDRGYGLLHIICPRLKVNMCDLILFDTKKLPW